MKINGARKRGKGQLREDDKEITVKMPLEPKHGRNQQRAYGIRMFKYMEGKSDAGKVI